MIRKKITISILIVTLLLTISSINIYAADNRIETKDYYIDVFDSALMITIKNQEFAYKTAVELYNGEYDINNIDTLTDLIANYFYYLDYSIKQSAIEIYSVATYSPDGSVRIQIPRGWYAKNNILKIKIYDPRIDVLPDPEEFTEFIRNYFNNIELPNY
jgi:hypothetical protein